MRQKYSWAVFENDIGMVWVERITLEIGKCIARYRPKFLHSLWNTKKDAIDRAKDVVAHKEHVLAMSKKALDEIN